jgi:hypothetical protein
MIERFVYFREEISKVIEKANNLSNSKKKKELNLESFNIEAVDWDYIIKIVDILEFFKKPTIKLQGSSSNVYTIVYISQLYIKLREIRYRVTDLFIKEGLKQAIDKLILYYPITSTNISKLKDLYLITVLDPHFKLYIFSTLDFNSEVISNIRLYFIEIYNNYKECLIIESNTTASFDSNSNLDLYINNYDSDDDLYVSNNTTTNNIENQIDIYLAEPRVAKDITIGNYYNTNKTRFPIIYNIARDYLAILTASTPSEATFSKVGNIVTKSRNRLLSNTIKKLIILKELNAIDDEEELINDNILFIEDNNDNNNNNIEEEIIEEDNLEDKSTTSITSYNSNNTANNSTNSNNS